MGLGSALASAVSGLNSQSANISAISQNVSNSSTTAYKTETVSFEDLVDGSGGQTSSVVTTNSTSNLLAQGAITSTDVSTNVAINGNGFFVVSNNTDNTSDGYTYTRDGSFTTNTDGYLVNDDGEYLLGWPTNSSGEITSDSTNDITSLSYIDTSTVKGLAQATSTLGISANLPADAAVGDTYTTSTEVYDSLGVSQTLTMTWDKTASNDWTLTISNPALTSDSSTTSGTISPSPATYDITFNGDGSIATATDAATGTETLGDLSFSVSGWTTGASDSTISLNLGTAGSTTGLTQESSGESTPAVDVSSITQDGEPYGTLSSFSISSSGLVTAKFSNGLSEPVYQIAVATFADGNALTQVSGNVYSANVYSGTPVLQDPGSGEAGTLDSSSLESSGTDITSEMSQMIQAEEAYSASSKLITTVDTMYQDLLQAVTS